MTAEWPAQNLWLAARISVFIRTPAPRGGRSGIVKGFRMPASHAEGLHGGRRPKSLEGGNRGGSMRWRQCWSMGISGEVLHDLGALGRNYRLEWVVGSVILVGVRAVGPVPAC